ncbi:Neutral trehalase-like protein [Hapsidospora chrysogenum ATCC 11550]|uniref:Trehalase n=1 Tax=Hapsidospora chrysogenum (strain ATCC 11550 / CBS 779.69 / DSM 880 / IAM 14645 / JCM 23072 / IMI 49137) TaxID=857340 RepID=A0A086T930_HAPC1|nr:Neutral trehalase-like protein [Hapsidospora chrysogenum ATCC 11550]
MAGTTAHRPHNADDYGVYDDAKTYYASDDRHNNRHGARTRTYSQNTLLRHFEKIGVKEPFRRGSHDERALGEGRRFLVQVEPTLKSLQEQEDTDSNMQITIEDSGPKVIPLRTAGSAGHNRFDVRGTYMLSNLLQELTLAKEYGRSQIILDEGRLNENPVDRLSRLVRDHFWEGLTRRIDASTVEVAARDPKDWTDDPRPRIYIPAGCPEQYEYYKRVAQERPEIKLDVQMLPKDITPDYVRDLNEKPGLLVVAVKEAKGEKTGKPTLEGLPFVVPGGRFNELYGWDSYMASLGLLVNERVDMVKSIVENFCFCIEHYGKILNATRSYYLLRSQPPFLTDMALRVYEKTKHEPDAIDFLKRAILAAIKEYHTVWTSEPRLDPVTGLSRYRPEGRGVPPETESTHFVHVLEPYRKKHNMEFQEFVRAYNYGEVHEPELDEYFMHDRAVRESGHDTTYRFEGVCANLATIDLNSLLFKYETDIARTIRGLFGDKIIMPEEFCAGTPYEPGEVLSSAVWDRRAKRRKLTMDKLMWNEKEGMFFDYDTVKKEQCTYETATTLWALWAGLATPKQAADMVKKGLPRFEAYGGLLAGTEKSRGEIGLERPNRQWDYPYGWAPQQMLAWTGLLRYSFNEEAERLAYKWLYMVTKAFVDFNGVVVEKYDVTSRVDPHRVDAEYGNQGLDFKGVAKEGFAWVNASYVYGLQIINAHMRRALGTLTPYPTFVRAMELNEEKALAALSLP